MIARAVTPNEGFIARVKNGKVDTKKVVSNPSEIGYERLINSRGTGLLQTIKDAPYDTKGKFVNSKTQYPVEVVAALYTPNSCRRIAATGSTIRLTRSNC